MTTQTIVMSRREIVSGLAAGAVVAIAPGCATNEELGRSQFLLVSNEQLAELSAPAWNEMKAQQPISQNRTYNDQLQRVGDKITAAAGRGEQSWEYAVFDSEQVNAFVLPGRQVGFYEGLMDLADNDSQLSTVFGHEVGHVTARHAAERYSQSIAASGAMAVSQIALSQTDMKYKNEIAAVLGLGVQFGVLLPFSRKHELEADRLGVDYMHRAGYDAREAVRFWEKMAAQGSGNRPPEYLSTHPAPETRIRALDQYIRNKGYV
ncbi:MAG: M48 family metallopeptidase [Caulobacterales bacterium]|nr:M48 family metallopeptidase [Caulobacterales bacterium]